MKVVLISTSSSEKKDRIKIKLCDDFFSRLKGLMFTRTINKDEGILLVQDSESKINSAIHMLFMNYDIAVFWLDQNLRIVDKRIAQKWRLIFSPSKPAKYILETHPANLEKFQVGELLQISSIL